MGLFGSILKATAGVAVAVVAAPVAVAAAAGAGAAGIAGATVVGVAAASKVVQSGVEVANKTGALKDEMDKISGK